mmetsp:Transcript_84834/g.186249  ORF Transcript_84834/g.186249 Transcript_84834/m.186249 type:complete len:481 (-) Transcript_84834:58-1500(-)
MAAAAVRSSGSGAATDLLSTMRPAEAELCEDLRRALAQADRRRQQAQDRLFNFEEEAEREEAQLSERLAAERAELAALRERGRIAAEREMRTRRVQSEMREVESERDAMERAAAALQNEVVQAKAQAEALTGNEEAAASLANVEQSLRSEAAALRSALAFCERRCQDGARQRARDTEAVRRHQEMQRDELHELEEAEERLRISKACVADALAMRRAPIEDSCSPETLRDAAAEVKERQEACMRAQQQLEELHEECGHLLRLNGAAETRVEELEQRLAQGGLRAAVERAMASLRKMDADCKLNGGSTNRPLQGAERLVYVLAQVCGVPRMAYLTLDSNRSGRVSMCEFDSGLRLRFGLDYEAISAMEKPVLRPLFKEFDIRKRGFLTEEDFGRCCSEIWEEFGREDWPVAIPDPIIVDIPARPSGDQSAPGTPRGGFGGGGLGSNGGTPRNNASSSRSQSLSQQPGAARRARSGSLAGSRR